MPRAVPFVVIATVLIGAGVFWFSRDSLLTRHDQVTPTISQEEREPARPKREPASILLKKLLEGGELPKLTPEELGAHVGKCGHSAASLLAAWQLGGDPAWLDEATQRYPDDPKVALAKLSTFKELNEDSREWIERLKKNDPGNAVGWCYDAMIAFKVGDSEQARDALAEAAGRDRFGSSFKEEAQSLAAAYQSAGYDGFASEVIGMASVPLPQAQLAQGLVKEAIAGLGPDLDDSVIQDMLTITRAVRGQDNTAPLVMSLVSAAMERKTLDQLSALELIPGTRKFVLERLDELSQERDTVKTVLGKGTPLLSKLNESELRQYMRRSTVEGELKAMQWLIGRHPEVK